jgi:hypothetical protein
MSRWWQILLERRPHHRERPAWGAPRTRCRPRVVFDFTITDGKVVEINLVADPARLRSIDLAILDD